jgi:predicted SprT family Zn-dependent metalloprotease
MYPGLDEWTICWFEYANETGERYFQKNEADLNLTKLQNVICAKYARMNLI